MLRRTERRKPSFIRLFFYGLCHALHKLATRVCFILIEYSPRTISLEIINVFDRRYVFNTTKIGLKISIVNRYMLVIHSAYDQIKYFHPYLWCEILMTTIMFGTFIFIQNVYVTYRYSKQVFPEALIASLRTIRIGCRCDPHSIAVDNAPTRQTTRAINFPFTCPRLSPTT